MAKTMVGIKNARCTGHEQLPRQQIKMYKHKCTHNVTHGTGGALYQVLTTVYPFFFFANVKHNQIYTTNNMQFTQEKKITRALQTTDK